MNNYVTIFTCRAVIDCSYRTDVIVKIDSLLSALRFKYLPLVYLKDGMNENAASCHENCSRC